VVFADLNNDGLLEIIAVSRFNGVYAWNHDGTSLPGWPFISNYITSASPAIGDVDGDNAPEIAVAGSYYFYLLRSNGSVCPGWPKSINGVWPGSPALYDIDNDGTLEIIVAYNGTGSAPSVLYVFNMDGTIAAGWPRTVGGAVKGSPAVADIDGDGYVEIVLSGNFDHNVYIWRHNGEPYPGWPQHDNEFSEAYCSASVGDLDNDGDMEIVSAGGSKIFVRHHDGTTAAGWPRSASTTIDGSPALADIDGDGDLEIFVGSSMGGMAYVWHHNGAFVQGWPVNTGGSGQILIDGSVAPTPAIGDVDGDGEVDIVIADCDSHNVYAFSKNGVPLANGWPKVVPEAYQYVASPAIGDIDKDGTVEVAIGTRGGFVYLWREQAAYDENTMEWPMFRHDLQQTGWYEGLRRGDLDGDGRVDLADYSELRNCLAGPGLHMPSDRCGPALFARADLDGDDDVDIRDYAVFQLTFAPRPK
jgi:hypothetical protein